MLVHSEENYIGALLKIHAAEKEFDLVCAIKGSREYQISQC